MKAILAILVSTVMYLMCYCFLSAALSRDIEYLYGTRRMKNRRKKMKGFKNFWIKFFYLDFRKDVQPWHYVCFWLTLVLYVPLTVLSILFFYDIRSSVTSLGSGICFFVMLAVSSLPFDLTYWGVIFMGNHGNTFKSVYKQARRR